MATVNITHDWVDGDAWEEIIEIPKFVKIPKSFNIKSDCYRYMSVEKALDFIEEGKFVFSNPQKWIDPFEKRFITADYSNILFEKPKSIYCTCFTHKSTSEAQWIMYSYFKEGLAGRSIKFVFNTRKLFKTIFSKFQKSNAIKIYCASICYDLKSSSILALHKRKSVYYKDIFSNFNIDRFADLLMLKRKAFEYEHEFRIIIFSDDKQKENLSISFTIEEIKDVIKHIYIDPHCSPLEFSLLKDKLETLLKGSNIEISKSKLYQTRNSIKIEGVAYDKN